AEDNSDPGPDYFYLFGWYRNGNDQGPWGIKSYDTPWRKYTLRENGDYVIEGGETVEDNPEWRIAQYGWEAGSVISRFWVCTNWGSSCPNLQATGHEGADEQAKFQVGYLTYNSGEIDILDASKQSDYMVAYGTKTQGTSVEDDILHLHFYHTLAKITFVDKTNGKIASLKLGGTYNGGSLTVSTHGVSEWFNLADTYRVKTLTGGNGSMYLMPQTATTTAPITITIVLQDGSEKTKSLNDVDWQVGYEYTYGLNLATSVATKASEADYGDFVIECISENKY
ncbi:MAG: fimbrillin family protein, partial [Bacteroidales bacterium]|nr:fimbrillin family protein [Bacteroidales bacterium]